MSFSWIHLSIISAVTLSASDALIKKATHEGNEYIVIWLRLLFSLPFLLFLFLFVPNPRLDSFFYIALSLAIPFNILAKIFFIKSLRLPSAGLGKPLFSLSLFIIIPVSMFMLGEVSSLTGGLGVLLVSVGCYTLNLESYKNGLLQPFKSILSEKGSLHMICSAFLLIVASVLCKIAISHSSPLYFAAVYILLITIFFAPIAFYQNFRRQKNTFKEDIPAALCPGIFYSITAASFMIALDLANVSYVLSLKWSGFIFSAFIGYLFLNKKAERERFLGAGLAIAGFILILYS